MKLERWKQTEEIYGALLEQPAEKQAAFLREACGADNELRREIESMLASSGWHVWSGKHGCWRR